MFMMGDGWDQVNNEPPIEVPSECEHFSSEDNGIWMALSHDLVKRLGDGREQFERGLSRLFCQFLKPCTGGEMPYNA